MIRLLFTAIFFIIGGALSILWMLLKWMFGFSTGPKPFVSVPYVLDGDSLAFDGDVRVRIYGMDAPEMDHPEGAASKAHLQKLIGGREVRITPKDADKYGRIVAKVTLEDGTDIGAQMVADGYARAYASFAAAYVGLERRARKNGAGLWGQGGLTIHPELWRKAQR